MKLPSIFKDRSFLIPLSILLGIVVYIIVYPALFIRVDPTRWYVVPKGLPPSQDYPFGTTLTGQNIADLVPIALRNSIVIGGTTALTSIAIAVVLSMLVVLVRKGVTATMTFIDTMCTIPPLPVLIVLLYGWRDYITMPLIGLILSIFGWAWPSRALISILSSLRERTFIHTSYLSGLPTYLIMVKDFIPYILRYILIGFVNLSLWGIGMETTVAMFGAMRMDIPTIGTTLYWSMHFQAFILGLWWWYMIPTLFLIVFILSLYALGVKLDEYLTAGV
ncbi:MAG: ABC transporter permease subunit [Ignisphaera sp.]|uniref:ABC transporter permease subunit n=1 Tax=Ignisphaera aggregans TaxID=334771 RepID=A0A7J3I8Y2_9CREN